MYDFLRFVPENFPDLGFKGYVLMLDESYGVARERVEGVEGVEREDVLKGIIIKAENGDELKKKLRKVRKDIIVGVVGDEEVYREAVMRRKVDMILDHDKRQIDFSTLKLAAEKDVTVELGLAKFIRNSGYERMKLFERLYDEVRVIKKFDVPFVVTTAAESFYELRTKKQVENFFSFFGCDIVKARQHATRLVRKYSDPSYIMDGFEIEADLGADLGSKTQKI